MSVLRQPYRVFLVVDEHFGEQLAGLPRGEPIWIVESEENMPVATRLRTANPEATHLDGVTTFEFIEDNLLDEQVVSIMDIIDMHHGPYSVDPPYSMLTIIGCPLTPRIQSALGVLGFNVLQRTKDRFTAVNSRANWQSFPE